MKKVILCSIDGMRPDGVLACGNPFVQKLMEMGSYSLNTRTVFPSVTLPCHTSMFHSVTPERHGITTNTYVPFARPFPGLFEQITLAGGSCAMYYGWEPLRDVARPGSLKWAGFVEAYTQEHTDGVLTDLALARIAQSKPDFVFLYMVETDEKGGHDAGWMSATYLQYISDAIDNVRRVWEAYGDAYTVIVTADHGGHDRGHGTMMDEDMTVPQFFVGPDFEAGRVLAGVSMLDLTPTIAHIMGVPFAREWEGRSLVKESHNEKSSV